jgi:hypothetical protein
MAANIFERLAKGRPPPVEKAQEVSPAQRLLDFVLRWPKDTVSARNIYQFGPRSTKKRREAMESIAVLIRCGWLAQVPGPRRDGYRFLRRPPIIHPTVDG